MARTRSDNKLSWLPERVYMQRKKYVWQPKSGGKITICATNCTKNDFYKAYNLSVQKHMEPDLLKFLIPIYYNSHLFFTLKHKTKIEYQRYHKDVLVFFGEKRAQDISQKDIFYYINKIASIKGCKSKPAYTTANRHKSSLQSFFKWCLQEGIIDFNPCLGVPKLRDINFINEPWKASSTKPAEWFSKNVDSFIKDINDLPNLTFGNIYQGVYFLFKDSKLIYVGKSNDVCLRLGQHKSKGVTFDYVKVLNGIPDLFIEDVEYFYINKYSPILNIKSKGFSPYLAYKAVSKQ